MSAAAPVGLAAVVDPVRSILRLEGLAVFAAAVAAYFHFGFAWWLFVLLALALWSRPDGADRRPHPSWRHS